VDDDQKATSIGCFSNGRCVLGGYHSGTVQFDGAGNFTAGVPFGASFLVFLDENGINLHESRPESCHQARRALLCAFAIVGVQGQ